MERYDAPAILASYTDDALPNLLVRNVVAGLAAIADELHGWFSAFLDPRA
jgi:ketosteroid isomerase-like protein